MAVGDWGGRGAGLTQNQPGDPLCEAGGVEGRIKSAEIG